MAKRGRRRRARRREEEERPLAALPNASTLPPALTVQRLREAPFGKPRYIPTPCGSRGSNPSPGSDPFYTPPCATTRATLHLIIGAVAASWTPPNGAPERPLCRQGLCRGGPAGPKRSARSSLGGMCWTA